MFQIKGTFCKGLKIHVGVIVIFHIYWTLYMIVQSKVKNMPWLHIVNNRNSVCVGFKWAFFFSLFFISESGHNSQLSSLHCDYCCWFGLFQSLCLVFFWNHTAFPRVQLSRRLQTQAPIPSTASMWNMSYSFFNGSTLSCQSLAPKGV